MRIGAMETPGTVLELSVVERTRLRLGEEIEARIRDYRRTTHESQTFR